MNAEPELPLVPPHTLAHASDPPSSIDAARQNQAGKVSGRRAILETHQYWYEGLTDDECSYLTGIELHECRRRCTDLRNAGLIEFAVSRVEPGRFLSRESNSGRRSTVSVITAAGHRALA
jgi:hypothetical protein